MYNGKEADVTYDPNWITITANTAEIGSQTETPVNEKEAGK
jgi:hypothetical protein